MHRVIIVEDDPMVAAIDRQYVEKEKRFRVVGTFKDGVQALAWLKTNDADLVILDYYTPAMNGLEFVDRMHAEGHAPSVIMVTSASDTAIVRELVARGVLDYLIKPFEYARFQQALEKFERTRQMLDSGRDNMSQEAIDRLMRSQSQAAEARPLGKGLNEATLKLIQGFLARHPGESFTSEQIADQVKLSRITIRRYVNHLVEAGELVSAIDYQTGGRPSIRYSFVR